MKSPKYPLARLSPVKDEFLVIAISRESVEACDIAPILEHLGPLSATREAALQWEGTLTFYFEGWDTDRRETAEIPEIRVYFHHLTDEWPYWWHYIEKVGDTFAHVLRLLCRGRIERIQPGAVGWRFGDMREVSQEMIWLFNGMNRLYERLELPETNNERVSQEIAELLRSTLAG